MTDPCPHPLVGGPVSATERREQRAREVLAERAEHHRLYGRAKWLRAGCPVGSDWPDDDTSEAGRITAQVSDMLAFADAERQPAPSADTLAQVAAIIKREHDAVFGPGNTLETPAPWLVAAATAAFEAGRRAGLEEAAGVAECAWAINGHLHEDSEGDPAYEYAAGECQSIATAIRALPVQPTGKKRE